MQTTETPAWECPICFNTGSHAEHCALSHRTTAPAAPTVHLNGTSYQDLYSQMKNAADALNEAIGRLSDAAPNGRDYYVQAPGAIQTAMDEHYARLAKLRSVKAEIEAIWMKISEQEPPTRKKITCAQNHTGIQSSTRSLDRDEPRKGLHIVRTTSEKILTCVCGATARNTTKERGRFRRRHPANLNDLAAKIHKDEQMELLRLWEQRKKQAEAKAREAAIKDAALQMAIQAAVRLAR